MNNRVYIQRTAFLAFSALTDSEAKKLYGYRIWNRHGAAYEDTLEHCDVMMSDNDLFQKICESTYTGVYDLVQYALDIDGVTIDGKAYKLYRSPHGIDHKLIPI